MNDSTHVEMNLESRVPSGQWKQFEDKFYSGEGKKQEIVNDSLPKLREVVPMVGVEEDETTKKRSYTVGFGTIAPSDEHEDPLLFQSKGIRFDNLSLAEWAAEDLVRFITTIAETREDVISVEFDAGKGWIKAGEKRNFGGDPEAMRISRVTPKLTMGKK